MGCQKTIYSIQFTQLGWSEVIVFMKHSHMLAGLALGLSLLRMSPAQAEPAQKEYLIGRIRGVTGDVAQIQIISAGISQDAHVRVTHDLGFATGERDVWKVTAAMPHLWPNLVA